MKHIKNIDALGLRRSTFSGEEREKQRQAKIQQQKDDGYQQLAELCRLGEYDAAKQLANRHPSWGYEVVDGVVRERSD
jgi:DNA-binding FadR family transcriptional regulator